MRINETLVEASSLLLTMAVPKASTYIEGNHPRWTAVDKVSIEADRLCGAGEALFPARHPLSPTKNVLSLGCGVLSLDRGVLRDRSQVLRTAAQVVFDRFSCCVRRPRGAVTRS